MPWRKEPIHIEEWDTQKFDNFIFLDERGISDTKAIKKILANGESTAKLEPNLRYLTLCACIIHRDNFLEIRDNIKAIKNKYWSPDGKHNYKTWRNKQQKYEEKEQIVVFHSSEINNKKGPFYDKLIDYNSFIKDLDRFLVSSKYTIVAVTIDKLKLLQKNCFYQNKDPYHVAYEMLLERVCFYLNAKNQNGALMNEWRGVKENKSLLNFIISIKENGNYFLKKENFKSIEEFYFNSKRDDSEYKSFFGLEIVDLILPSLAKFNITKHEDVLFKKIKNKLYKYPNFHGQGLKKFP